MDEIKRQHDQDLKHAVQLTIEQRTDRALHLLKPRVFEVEDREARLQSVADSFCRCSPEEREKAMVLTGSNADRRELNELVRTTMERDGALTGPPARATILVPRRLTDAQTRDSWSYETGNVVRFGRAYKRIGVKKGEYFRVEQVDMERERVILTGYGRRFEWRPKHATKVEAYAEERRALQRGDRIRFTRNNRQRGYINSSEAIVVEVNEQTATIEQRGIRRTIDLTTERHFDHAYARTVHSAQGRTTDEVLIHIDTTQPHLVGHESWYVALSRARNRAEVFTDDVERLPKAIAKNMQQEAALEIVKIPEREHTLTNLCRGR